MIPASEILTVDASGEVPLVPGDYFIDHEKWGDASETIETRFQSALRVGRRLAGRPDDGLCLVIQDSLWSAASGYEAVFRGDDVYIIRLRLAGNGLEIVNGNTYACGAYTCWLVHYAPGVRHISRLLPGESLIEVCIGISRHFMMRKYGISASAVDEVLKPAQHRRLDPWFNQCRMTREIEQAIHDLRSASLVGQSWRLFLEAKTLELLSLYFRQLESRPPRRSTFSLTYTDVQRLHAAREFVGKNYRQSPRIDDLCGAVGLSRRKLTAGFKAEFGRTVFEYLQYVRMEQARALFQTGLTDIGRVASRVGYSHQGNFSKAFRRYAGMSPRQAIKVS